MPDLIAVLGATGFIGANVVKYLAASGHRIVLQYRNPVTLSSINQYGVSNFQVDFLDPNWDRDYFCQAIDGCSTIYNLVA
ncbi:MAG: NAD-dependent epimerase/dehydratase family protein, partial [Desulfamplus sp.]|nr:NAD-dependent epimerase/dehydratase family protein [Desulfamplus sp.]